MRRAIVHGVECEPNASDVPAGARIQYRSGQAAGAGLLAGWLRSKLSWASKHLPVVDESHEPEEELSVTLQGRDWRVSASMAPECVKVVGTSQPAFEVPRSREHVPEHVATEMRSLGYDTALRDAVGALA